MLRGIAVTAAVAALVFPTAPVAQASSAYPCMGAEDFTTTKAWEFNEPTGSTVFHESLHGNPADDLKPLAGYPAPYASGAAVWFYDDSILATTENVFNPEEKDFAVCVKFLDNVGDDSCNVWQINNRHPSPSKFGTLKVTPWYTYVQSTSQRFPVWTGLTTMEGLGYKTITLTRRGNVFTTYVDGVVSQSHTTYSPMVIHLIQRMAVGGKIEQSGHTSTTDMLDGRIASVRVSLEDGKYVDRSFSKTK
jgi:hypothetical protein